MMTILALGCLLFLTGGYHLLYQVQLAEVKSAVKKDLSLLQKINLTQLAFSATEAALLNWEDESEFCYQNKMYDVVKVEKQEGQTIYWCFSDEKETALVNAYLKTQNGSSDKDSSHSLFKLLKTPFLPAVFLDHNKSIAKSSLPFPHYALRLFSMKAFVLTPPPKAC